MPKLIIDNAKKVDITAKRLNNFSVTLSSLDPSGDLISYTEDRVTPSLYNEHFTSDAVTNIYAKISVEDLILFVITGEDETPVLAACSSNLDLAAHDTDYFEPPITSVKIFNSLEKCEKYPILFYKWGYVFSVFSYK